MRRHLREPANGHNLRNPAASDLTSHLSICFPRTFTCLLLLQGHLICFSLIDRRIAPLTGPNPQRADPFVPVPSTFAPCKAHRCLASRMLHSTFCDVRPHDVTRTMEFSRTPASSFAVPRRVFTAPVPPSSAPQPTAAAPQSAGGSVETLYDSPNVKIVSFTAASRALSVDPRASGAPDIEPGSLPWSTQLERTIAVGTLPRTPMEAL